MPVEIAKRCLVKWLQENRRHVLLTAFSPSVIMSTWRRRPEDYTAMLRSYLKMDGEYVSHIGILNEAVTRGYISGRRDHVTAWQNQPDEHRQ
jgi:hypothetical protein